MTYLIHPEPYVKQRCPICSLFYLTPQSQPAKRCPDCIEFARRERAASGKAHLAHAQSAAQYYREYYKQHRQEILRRKRERRAGKLASPTP
jgi:hypothetical protein